MLTICHLIPKGRSESSAKFLPHVLYSPSQKILWTLPFSYFAYLFSLLHFHFPKISPSSTLRFLQPHHLTPLLKIFQKFSSAQKIKFTSRWDADYTVA